MSDYTPTMAELKDYATSYSAIASEAEWDRALAAHDAAKRAEWEAEGETDWEYGCASSSHRRFAGSAVPLPCGVDPDEHSEECPSPALVHRRKAGAWLPVPDTRAKS